MLQVDQRETVKETIGADLMLGGKVFCTANTISRSQRSAVKQRLNDGRTPPDSQPPTAPPTQAVAHVLCGRTQSVTPLHTHHAAG